MQVQIMDGYGPASIAQSPYVPPSFSPPIAVPPTTTSATGAVYPTYHKWMSVVTGALRITLVVVAVILEVIAVHQGSTLIIYRYMTIWNGICMLAAGILGIVAGVKKDSGSVVAHMVLSILNCSIFTWIQVILSGISWGADTIIQEVESDDNVHLFGASMRAMDYKFAASIMFIGLVQFVLNLWGSILCCGVSCCAPHTYPPTPMQTTVVHQTTGYPGHPQPPYAQQWQQGAVQPPSYQPPAQMTTNAPPQFTDEANLMKYQAGMGSN